MSFDHFTVCVSGQLWQASLIMAIQEDTMALE